ncbi:hypothetical protein ILUMI_22388 [Ignelater luminosus]|uniref:Uncharacterized protein n=1 Tax=Ignelater luminosus TaxID=2038154 RepID=A0A8K0CEI4_IGNLU|nr:hypothetical protein ILUMI_22388 [Ignelater luminosus]
MDSEPHWKRVWRAVSGTSKAGTPAVVDATLDVLKEHLLKGLTVYPSYAEVSLNKCVESYSLNDAMKEFMRSLSIALDLDSCRAWFILNNFLTYEDFGKTEDVNDYVKDETSKKDFINKIWQFYTMERTYLLKILSVILENHKNISHPLHSAYSKFIDFVTYKELRESLFKQYSLLMNELILRKSNHMISLSNSVDRNSVEMVHILLLILTIMEIEKFTVADFLEIFKLIKQHSFTSTPECQEIIKHTNPVFLQHIRDCENTIFIAAFANFWNNQDAWYSHIDEIDKMIKEIIHSTEASVMLITWAALLSTLPTELAKMIYDRYSHAYVTRALQDFVFKDLCKIIRNPIFQKCFPGMVAKTAVFTLFDILCISFNEENVFVHDGSTDLLAELLREHKFAVLSLSESEGAKAFYLLVMRSFPYNFWAFTIITQSLISLKRDTKRIFNELLQLNSYTEVYLTAEQRGLHLSNNMLTRAYRPFNNDLIVFPAGTTASLLKRYGETFVEIEGTYSYFHILRNAVNSLFESLKNEHAYERHILSNVKAGYRLLLEVLRVDPALAFGSADVKYLLQLALCLLPHCIKPQTKKLSLLKICFEIAIYMFKQNHSNIIAALIAQDFLPKSSRDFFTHDFSSTQLLLPQSSLIQYIEEDIQHKNSYKLLHLYLQLVGEALMRDVNYEELQVPGYKFFLIKVFPVFVRQFTETLCQEKQHIIIDLIELTYNIMKEDENTLKDHQLTIYKYIMDLFISSRLHAKSLMSLFAFGNTKLHLLLIIEMNWHNGWILKVVHTVKRSLQCVLYVLKYIKAHEIKSFPIFEDLLTMWDFCSASMLKVVSTYLNHCFDPEIPKVACDILTAFVNVSNRPLLHSLQMSNYRLRHMFLEHLSDSLDNQETKVSVIRLVIACLMEQSSMTATFFNISVAGEETDCSILDCIQIFLKNIEKNPNALLVPLHGAILDLLHELWKSNNQHLLKKLTDQKDFWPIFTSPLIKSTRVPIDILLQVLEIIVLELHFSKQDIKEKFDNIFQNLLNNSSEFFNIWINHLTEISTSKKINCKGANCSLAESVITIWKNFMLSIKLLNKPYFDREWNTPQAAQKCLDGLLLSICTDEPKEVNVIKKWAELFLLFVDFSSEANDTEKGKLFTVLTNILFKLSKFYELLDINCKVTILASVCKVVTNLKEFLENNPNLVFPFLNLFEAIFYHEYRIAFLHVSKSEECYRNWILVLQTTNVLMEFKNLNDHENFFIHTRFVERLCEVLGRCINHSLPVRISKLTAMSLVKFAESPLVHHFQHIDLLNTSKQILPPLNCNLQRHNLRNGVIPEHLKNWWSVYIYIVQLNGVLLLKLKEYMPMRVLEFVYIHQVYLCDALSSAMMLADSSNLELVVEILRFLYIVLEYRHEWSLGDHKSYINIMITVKEVLNSAIGVILRPKCLIFVPTDVSSVKPQEDTVPSSNLIGITDSFLEIIGWACKCFTRCNPPFTNLMEMYKPLSFDILVEYDFRVPPAVNDKPHLLTYGSLLCILHFICKVLTQKYFQEKERLGDDAGQSSQEQPKSVEVPKSLSPLKQFNIIILPLCTKETLESISALHGFTVPEIMSLQAPWLIDLDTNILMTALSALTTFLAGQAFLTVRDETVERNLMRYIKRELCSELLLFYDFVHQYLHKKYVLISEEHKSNEDSDTVVVTPHKTHSKIRLRIPTKSAMKGFPLSEEDLLVDISRICSDRPSGKKTEINNLDDSYLLMLVHWFRHVCRLVHYSKFDEFLSQWHAKSTCVTPHSTFVKNTSVHLSDEEDEIK